MHNLDYYIQNYIDTCHRRNLSEKTISAYKTDLSQLQVLLGNPLLDQITITDLALCLDKTSIGNNPRTVKRKIASCRAFFRYLHRHDIFILPDAHHLELDLKEPLLLPKTISISNVEALLEIVYHHKESAKTVFQRRIALRDAAMMELLFATGIRISELCSLSRKSVSLANRTITILGKGAKERILQIGNNQVHDALVNYKEAYDNEISLCNHLFVNQQGRPLSDQSVRRMLNYYTNLAGIKQHITPHMWRHTFATSLLDADVDIRYIQEMLGHSSIRTTEIYTHVSMSKQKDILCNKHPRNSFSIRPDIQH